MGKSIMAKPKKAKQPLPNNHASVDVIEQSLTTIQAECRRLREKVKALEEQHERNQETLARVENYRQFFIAWAKKEFSEESIPPRSEWVPFLPALEELEKAAGK
jgi:hypothetical protein